MKLFIFSVCFFVVSLAAHAQIPDSSSKKYLSSDTPHDSDTGDFLNKLDNLDGNSKIREKNRSKRRGGSSRYGRKSAGQKSGKVPPTKLQPPGASISGG